MSNEGSSLGNVNNMHGNHHHQQQQQHHNGSPSSGVSGSFHPPPAPYLSSGYGSYMTTGMGAIASDGSSGASGQEMGIYSLNPMRNSLKRAGDDLDTLANGAARVSPRERERERERQRIASGTMPYTPTVGSGGDGPSTPSQSGFLPASSSDTRFRGYGPSQGTPSSVGPAPPMSTPFNFTPRSPYDSSLGGNSSLMNTPASHQQTPYQHAHSHSYPQHPDHGPHGHSHSSFGSGASPAGASMGVSTVVPDFMRSSHGPPLGSDHSLGHIPHYGYPGGFEHDPYHSGRGAPPASMPLQGPIPQPVPTIPEGAPRASLEIDGDLERQVFGWDHEEWTNGRRLLQFWRRQEGTTIHASFKNVLQREYDQPEGPRGIIISCIFRPDKNECFITSVDLIYLLESLINNRFTVEEKNRIRRNLEGFRPITISKNKPDCSAFFKRIMGFPAPKPRNIEKDVKVFAWASLRPALCKIVGKYYASYTPGTASGPTPGLAMGQDLPGGPMGTPGSSGSIPGMSGSQSMPLGVVGVASRTPSLEQQLHRGGGSGAAGRSPATGGGASVLQGSPIGGNMNASLAGTGMGPPSHTTMSSMGSSGAAGPYSHSHPLSLQGGAYGDYHAPHSAASTPTAGQGAASTSAFYADYMNPSSGYGHDHSSLNSLNGTPAMTSVGGIGTPSGAPHSNARVSSGSSSNPPLAAAGSVGLGLGPSPIPPPPPSSTQTHGSNYVYSPSAAGSAPGGVSGGYNASAMLSSITGVTGGPNSSMSSSDSAASLGAGGGSGPSPAGTTAGPGGNSSANHSGGSGQFPVPTIGGVGGDVSHDFASGILPAPQPGRARGLSASLGAAASSTGFRRM